MKAQIYKIFNEIQTRTNTMENQEAFYEIFEKNKIKEFNEVIENVFLIIFKNFDKNNVILKNIKEFIKSFLEKIIKQPRNNQHAKSFINHFCKLFTSNVKKPKYKNLCIYFLNIFLVPYSSNFKNFYNDDTMEDIKTFILNILRSKQTQQHMQVLKLLQKHVILQNENDVWERLENLLNTSTQLIKKEILKLLEIDNENILNYLLEMYDDESIEIRNFVFDKLSELKNFKVISPPNMVRLLFVGLSDSSPKVQTSAKKFLKNYLNSIGVFKSLHSDQMLVDEEMQDSKTKNLSENLQNLNIEEEEKEELLASEKIKKMSSPMRILNKKKLSDSPSRVFDQLDIKNFYTHPKYSYTFQLITEALIDFTEHNNIINYIKSIVDNLINVTQSNTEKKPFSTDKNFINIFSDSAQSSKSHTRSDKYEIFNDIFFLHHTIRYYSNQTDETSVNIKNIIFECLPDNKTFSKIIDYFYRSEPNVMILHQLLLITLFLEYEDEIGNQEILKVLKRFIVDIELEKFTMDTVSFRKLDFDNNKLNTQPDELYNQEDITTPELIKNLTENLLLPPTRKIIYSMEDLVEIALKIMHKIFNSQPGTLFTEVMASLNEINEPLDNENEAPLKKQQQEIIESIKEKMVIISSLEEKKNKKGARERIENENKINREKKELEELEDKLYDLNKREKNIVTRKLKFCEFLIKYSRQPSQSKLK